MRRAPWLALVLALCAQAQEEPTPFWIAPPETAAPRKKKSKKPAEVQRKRAPARPKREKPAAERRRTAPAPPAEPQATWIEPDPDARLPEKTREPAVNRQADPRKKLEPVLPSDEPLSTSRGPVAPAAEPPPLPAPRPIVERVTDAPRGPAPKWTVGLCSAPGPRRAPTVRAALSS